MYWRAAGVARAAASPCPLLDCRGFAACCDGACTPACSAAAGAGAVADDDDGGAGCSCLRPGPRVETRWDDEALLSLDDRGLITRADGGGLLSRCVGDRVCVRLARALCAAVPVGGADPTVRDWYASSTAPSSSSSPSLPTSMMGARPLVSCSERLSMSPCGFSTTSSSGP